MGISVPSHASYSVTNCLFLALSIFCGHGENEVRLAKLGVFQSCLAVDISQSAIHQARRLASQEMVTSIDFGIFDLNIPDILPSSEFDLVIAKWCAPPFDGFGKTSQICQKIHEPNTLSLL